jgi:hypothetical protein
MINQHLQAAIAELQEFIDDRPDAREVRKALAVIKCTELFQKSNISPIDENC